MVSKGEKGKQMLAFQSTMSVTMLVEGKMVIKNDIRTLNGKMKWTILRRMQQMTIRQ